MSDQDPLPRVATIPALGYGWVDLIRTINAISIFGRGFGELLKPVVSEGMCPQWATLPTQRYLLAASNVDLNKIMDRFGDRLAVPWLLTLDLRWIPHTQSILECPCQDNLHTDAAQKQHIEPIQTLWPARALHRMNKVVNEALALDGAMIFGHQKTSGFLWSDTSDKQASRKDFERNAVVSDSRPMHLYATVASSLSHSTSDSSTFYTAISLAPTQSSTISDVGIAQNMPKASKARTSYMKKLLVRLFNKNEKRAS